MDTETINLDWLTWWAGGCVLQSDPSWVSEAMLPLESARKRAFMHANASLASRYFQLPMQLPPEPVASLMQIGALSVFQRASLLNLIVAVCQPAASSRVSEEQATWCRRLAKALRPGLWLAEPMTFADQDVDALTLLRARYGEHCWPRLRLLFPQPWVMRCREPTYRLPSGRLTALCDALLWKAAATTQNEPLS